jgi:hypothetical protein
MTEFEIVFEVSAISDIKDSKLWYNLRKSGLGLKFQNHVTKQIQSLINSPEKYAIKYDDVRCIFLKKFPFLFHTSRNPQIWHKRELE